MKKHQKIIKIALFLLLVFVIVFVFYKTAEAKSLTENVDKYAKKPWKTILSIVDYATVIFLVIISFINILRIQIDAYAVKKVLPTLILGVILANLSWFICMMFIDISELLMSWAASGAGIADYGGANNNLFLQMFTIISAKILQTPAIVGIASAVFAGATLGASLLVLIPLIILLTLFPIILGGLVILLLWWRGYYIIFLVIASPLAFLAISLPITQKLFQQWMNEFLKWVFLGPLMWILFRIVVLINDQLGTKAFIASYVLVMAGLYAAVRLPFMLGGNVGSMLMGLGAAGSKKVGGMIWDNVKRTPFDKQGTTIGGFAKGFMDKITKDRENIAAFSGGAGADVATRYTGAAKETGSAGLDSASKEKNWLKKPGAFIKGSGQRFKDVGGLKEIWAGKDEGGGRATVQTNNNFKDLAEGLSFKDSNEDVNNARNELAKAHIQAGKDIAGSPRESMRDSTRKKIEENMYILANNNALDNSEVEWYKNNVKDMQNVKKKDGTEGLENIQAAYSKQMLKRYNSVNEKKAAQARDRGIVPRASSLTTAGMPEGKERYREEFNDHLQALEKYGHGENQEQMVYTVEKLATKISKDLEGLTGQDREQKKVDITKKEDRTRIQASYRFMSNAAQQNPTDRNKKVKNLMGTQLKNLDINIVRKLDIQSDGTPIEKLDMVNHGIPYDEYKGMSTFVYIGDNGPKTINSKNPEHIKFLKENHKHIGDFNSGKSKMFNHLKSKIQSRDDISPDIKNIFNKFQLQSGNINNFVKQIESQATTPEEKKLLSHLKYIQRTDQEQESYKNSHDQLIRKEELIKHRGLFQRRKKIGIDNEDDKNEDDK